MYADKKKGGLGKQKLTTMTQGPSLEKATIKSVRAPGVYPRFAAVSCF